MVTVFTSTPVVCKCQWGGCHGYQHGGGVQVFDVLPLWKARRSVPSLPRPDGPADSIHVASIAGSSEVRVEAEHIAAILREQNPSENATEKPDDKALINGLCRKGAIFSLTV
uniref:Uncharacterized protein n=1 Tax=Branchiostoma floridae TaxID=7739 RepID=C3YLS5_BRAFL|eukprot:XP_002602507.1 hypothetical protein BRAFLDRAFT_93814 [Branchiostoma floridae]